MILETVNWRDIKDEEMDQLVDNHSTFQTLCRSVGSNIFFKFKFCSSEIIQVTMGTGSISQGVIDYRQSRRDGADYVEMESKSWFCGVSFIANVVTRDAEIRVIRRQYGIMNSHITTMTFHEFFINCSMEWEMEYCSPSVGMTDKVLDYIFRLE